MKAVLELVTTEYATLHVGASREHGGKRLDAEDDADEPRVYRVSSARGHVRLTVVQALS